MKRALRHVASLATLSLLALPLGAWDNFGHMAVASVAYRNLDSQTRLRVDKLLALNPYYASKWAALIPKNTAAADRKRMVFMIAATWPDAIKRDAHYHDDGDEGGDRPTGPEAARNTGYDDLNRHKYWHFVDQPLSQDGSDTTSVAVPVPDAETQIDAFMQVLLSADSSDGLKSYDLVWLLHLVGDIHQPLHCATRVSASHPQGDAGGNDVAFCGVGAGKCDGELHAFWDDILGTSNSIASADKFAAELDVPSSTPGTDESDVKSWIADSFALAGTNVYVAPVDKGDGPYQATAKYTGDARTLARQQVALGGIRLAAILKADLKSGN